MNNNIFSIDYGKFVMLMLPSALRKSVLFHLLYRLITPIVSMYNSFSPRRLNNLMYARYDSGRGNIERLLNYVLLGSYSTTSKTNQIEVLTRSSSSVESDMVFLTDTLQDYSIYLGFSYLDAPLSQCLIEIRVPVLLSDKLDKIDSIARSYVMPGYGYIITTK